MKRWTLYAACALMALIVAAAGCSALLPQSTSPTSEPTALPTHAPEDTPTPEPLIPDATAALPLSTETIVPIPVTPGQNTLNILLLGSDQRQGQAGPWRTDVIMWVTIHRDTKQVGIVSIPRDLWVSIPKVGENRINVADYYGETLKYPGGGPALVADTLKNNLGLESDRYIRLNFEAFEQVIDAMGGVTVLVDCAVEDNFIDPTYPGGLRPLRVSAGTQVMDGKTALMFARSRHGRGDIDRTRRQQRLLMAIRDRALDVEMIPRIPRIWVSLKKSVDTDLSLQEILSLALLAKDISADQIHSRVMDYTMLRDWTTPAGAMVLLPDRAKIKDAIEHLMDSPPLMESSRFPGTCP
jgi:LCP family protein required for cell wall assembly